MKKVMSLRADDGEGVGPRTQYAALPWRVRDELEVLLITTRETRRWIIPKGWPMEGRKPHAVATTEAFEEAGVQGRTEKRSIGSFHYDKRLRNGATVMCRVEVFPMQVASQCDEWPERHQRTARWFPYKVAAEHVDERELKDLIRAFGVTISKERGKKKKATCKAA
jgi:8-oxo-dGTP pyrophosphatase MutT (NUDIX family)